MTRELDNAARLLRDELDGSATLSADQRVELRQRIDASLAGKSSRRGLWALAAVAGAVAAAVAFLLWARPEPGPPGWYRIQSGTRCVVSSGDPSELRISRTSCGPVVVALGDDSVEILSKGTVKRSGGAIRLVRGRARFRVRSRRQTERRFRVLVSHGTIEALGTVFEVIQRRDRGQLRVDSGVVAFLWRDNTRVRVPAGEVIHWPRPRGAERPTVGPPADQQTPEGEPAGRQEAAARSDPEALLERHLQLVSQRRYEEAVNHLRRALRDRSVPHDHRARLSFELGVLLEDSLGQRESACRHWRDHLARFDQQRWKDEVQRRHRRCQDR